MGCNNFFKQIVHQKKMKMMLLFTLYAQVDAVAVANSCWSTLTMEENAMEVTGGNFFYA